MKTWGRALVLALALAGQGVMAEGKVPEGLRSHKQINEGLTTIAIADMIRKKCDRISPRMVRAYLYARELKSMAEKEGYSEDEIRAFVENKREKKRVEDAARSYLSDKGVVLDQPRSYCPVGKAEIARNSAIGQLLQAD